VVVSFTSGDPPLALRSLGGGVWTGTWVPAVSVASSVVRAAEFVNDFETPA